MIKLLLGCFLLLHVGLSSAETRDASQFFDQKLGDFKAELASAKSSGKTGILFMFETEDCPFCYRMKQTVLNQSEVQDYFRSHFLIFNIDIRGAEPMVDFKGKETTEKVFAAENRARATPAFVFYGLDGNQLTRLTGATKDAHEFMQFGRYVVEGGYKTMSFIKYKQGNP